MKRQATDWKKAFANFISGKRHVSRIYKGCLPFNTDKTNSPNWKWIQYLNGHLTKEYVRVVNKHMNRCSVSSVIRETQTKTSKRKNQTKTQNPPWDSTVQPLGWASSKQGDTNKCWRRCEGWEPCKECKVVQPLWKRACNGLKKVNVNFPCSWEIPLVSIYTREQKTYVQTKLHTQMFIAAFSITARKRNQSETPINWQKDNGIIPP